MNLPELINRPSTLADSVEESLLQYVKQKNLEPGAPLPKEEEIAAQLNVSRHIVREGISGLKTLGIIESRKRKGMFIKHRLNAFESVRKLAAAHLFSPEEYVQFMQIRIIMEMGMARYIWKNRTKENICELKKLASGKNELPSIQQEIDFHSKLFSMGGNDIANQFQNILISSFEYYSFPPAMIWDDNIPTHIQICEVLESGTLEDFCNIMEKHFECYTSDQK